MPAALEGNEKDTRNESKAGEARVDRHSEHRGGYLASRMFVKHA